jgi:hypothetical protein
MLPPRGLHGSILMFSIRLRNRINDFAPFEECQPVMYNRWHGHGHWHGLTLFLVARRKFTSRLAFRRLRQSVAQLLSHIHSGYTRHTKPVMAPSLVEAIDQVTVASDTTKV